MYFNTNLATPRPNGLVKISMDEMASALGLPYTTFYNYVRNGRVPGEFVNKESDGTGRQITRYFYRADVDAIKRAISERAPSEVKAVKPKTYNTKQFCRAAGVTAKQLSNWRSRLGLKVGETSGGAGSGKGYGYRYTDEDVKVVQDFAAKRAADLPRIYRERAKKILETKQRKKIKKIANGFLSAQKIELVLPEQPMSKPDVSRETIGIELIKAGFDDAGLYLLRGAK